MADTIITEPVLIDKTIEIKKFEVNDKSFLHFIFKKKFTEEMSVSATEVWTRFCRENDTVKFIHIWDCQNMIGFDNSAKRRWMDHMGKLKDQTEKIILISSNIMIRGAARIMSRVSNHELTVYKTFEEVRAKELR